MATITPLDPMDVSNHPLLSDLQGNILKGHGREHTTHIFVHFDAHREKTAREWLKNFAEEHVTSFQKQLREREIFKRNRIAGGLFTSVFLTSEGYKYLGFSDVDEQLRDPGFISGMKGRLDTTNDPAVSTWEKGYRQPIHAMILLADDEISRMGALAKDILDSLDKFSHICSIEYGNAIRNANGDGLEHFGYVDGVSQPLFLKDEVDDYMRFHNTSAQDAFFDPTASTDLVLIPDPYTKSIHSFGSYFVFRKLEQNVKGFKNLERKIGKQLFPDDEEKQELVGSMLVGRFEDGTPVVLSDENGLIGSGNVNNFNYKAPFNDPSGGRCPHFAHIRKTNPRQDIFPGDDHKKHIMARRGIPFGHREVDTALDPSPLQMPEGGVGLLFMSYQASIEKQFEFIQMNWANNSDFPQETNTGIDPIIGQRSDQDRKRSYTFPKEYGSTELQDRSSGFEQFVHMKGGEYFFAPSMSFLKTIDTVQNL